MTSSISRRLLTLTALTVLAVAPLRASTGGAMTLIPKDAVTVGVVHLDDVRTSPLSRMLFEQTDKVTGHGQANDFLVQAGLDPAKDVDLIVVTTAPVSALGTDARILVAAEGRFDIARITGVITSHGAIRKTSGANTYYLLQDKDGQAADEKHQGAVAFLSNHLAVAGTEAAVIQAISDNAAGGSSFSTTSGLGRDQARIDPKATAWALVDVTRASRLTGGAHVPGNNVQSQALSSALKTVSTVAVWATDAGDSLKLGATGVSADDETRQLLEDTIRGMISGWRLAVQDKVPELVSVLRKFTVTNGRDSVTLSGTIPADTLKSLKSKAITMHTTEHVTSR